MPNREIPSRRREPNLPPDQADDVRQQGHTIRGRLLLDALGLVERDRNAVYGPPSVDHRRAADVLNALGYQAHGGRELLPHDISVMLIAVKMSRIVESPQHEDSYKDIAGYAACGWESAVSEEEE